MTKKTKGFLETGKDVSRLKKNDFVRLERIFKREIWWKRDHVNTESNQHTGERFYFCSETESWSLARCCWLDVGMEIKSYSVWASSQVSLICWRSLARCYQIYSEISVMEASQTRGKTL